MIAAAILLLGAAAPLPVPVENGLQPPMRFDCRGTDAGPPTRVEGRISRFYLKAAEGMGLLQAPVDGAFLDHVVVELRATGLGDLGGRYDLNARYPLGTDTMVLAIPGKAGQGGFTLTASPVRSGAGYQAFTRLTVEQAGRSGPTWTGTCTTVLPEPTKKKP